MKNETKNHPMKL